MSREPISNITEEHLVTLMADDTAVAVSLIRTPKGRRIGLKPVDQSASIWIDPLGLESLTWQERDTFTALTGGRESGVEVDLSRQDDDDGADGETHLIDISNEYAIVTLFVTPADEIRIVSKRLGHSIRLSPVELAALAHQDSALISSFLETPFGPEHGPG